MAAELNDRPSLPGNTLADLRQQVQGAITMAPAQGKTGQKVLEQIDQRTKGPAGAAPAAMQHLGRNPEGWFVTETANFRIFHKQDDAFAVKVGGIAERTRAEAARKWFGNEPAVWSPRCELIVYATGDEYRL